MQAAKRKVSLIHLSKKMVLKSISRKEDLEVSKISQKVLTMKEMAFQELHLTQREIIKNRRKSTMFKNWVHVKPT